jgi:acetolactate synthase-1/2/3 large subunit
MMTVSKREKLQVTTRNDEKKPKSGADIVVQTLEQRGVEYVFGVPGAKIDKIFDSLVDSKIRTVVCRHEQNAAFIAGGIGRMTGKAGVAIATSGPGVSNLVTGLATANTEGDPVVALGGAVQVSDRLKKIHQTMDSVSLCKPVTKYSAEVDSSESVSEVLTNAFRSAESDRPGAAFVSLPMDIMVARAECDVLVPPAYSGAGPADIAAIRETARLINQAERPVVLLGLLASKPQNAVAIQELIESGKLPVVGTFQAAGAVSASLFSNFAGRVGQINNQPADEILAGSDLVITVGYDPVEYWPSIWNKGKKRPIVHLDVLPADIDNSYNPSVELVGDIASTLVHLTPLVSRSALEPSVKRLLERIANDREELARSSAGLSGTPVHPLRIAAELQRILTPDTTLCLDMGSFHLWMARHLYSFRARQILISNGQQTLGVALPWAIAATLVRPSEKVLSISGDGGFLFSAMELETAVRLKSNLVHMILIDGSYDMVAEQEILKYNRPSGTDFGPVDPVKYAEAFGAKGLMVRSPEQIPSVLKQAFDTSGPVLVGVHVDDRDNRKMFEQVDERSIH